MLFLQIRDEFLGEVKNAVYARITSVLFMISILACQYELAKFLEIKGLQVFLEVRSFTAYAKYRLVEGKRAHAQITFFSSTELIKQRLFDK